MLQGILLRSHLKPRGAGWWVWAPTAGAVAAAVAVWMFLTFAYQVREQDEFLVRGDDHDASPEAYQLSCSPADKQKDAYGPARCRPGDTLVFHLRPGRHERYFSTAALGPKGLVVWYFPSDTEESLTVEGDGLAERGIVIGPEHVPGVYRVVGLFTPDPVTQSSMRKLVEAYLAGPQGRRALHVEELQVVAP